MVCLLLALVGIILALIPAATFLANLSHFRLGTDQSPPPQPDPPQPRPSVSVLIPARDEEAGIGQSVRAALASRHVNVEVIVLDDHSTDATAEIVRQMAGVDQRVRYAAGAALPPGWNGKQHACWQLASLAQHDRFVFLDADVRLKEDGLARLIQIQDASGVALLSVFPCQETGTVLEKMLIPMMHFILLGFLPMARMRASCHPAYAAGCGQLFLTHCDAYQTAGTHAAIRASRHDGLKLPRVYRQAGLMTDVVDGTALAHCRMYVGASEVIRGVLKNAVEGIAAPKLIVPFSVLLLGGSVLPSITLIWALVIGNMPAIALSAIGVLLGHLPRAVAASKLNQAWTGVVLHSPSVLIFVALQWVALANHLLGRQIAWRGRTELVGQATRTTNDQIAK
ncbi:MAG: glycosyltransferase family 2 protein [Pirellulales bacterium]|nr:glycosyltransferase family 2 protein [Pirellulales bacterium]